MASVKSVKKEIGGLRFGRLTVISDSEKRRDKRVLWNCVCDCGGVKTVSGKHLRAGLVRSCGCLLLEKLSRGNPKHGLSRHSAYLSWVGMIARCEHPHTEQWKRDYQARGIKVCERWHDVRNFIEDMGERPPRMTIERINNDGDYEPLNCRWATRCEQNQNMRTNRTVYVDGIKMTARQASRFFGFKHHRCSGLAKTRGVTHQEIVDGWFREFES